MSSPQNVSARPRSRICQAVDVVRRVMAEENCKLHKGFVYKFIPESTATYTFYKSVKDYIMRIIGNQDVADVICGVTWEVIKHLKEPSCRMISQLKINYNFIEVNDGMFFNIEKKSFESDVDLRGSSPRAFVIYAFNAEKIPKPKHFIEGKRYKVFFVFLFHGVYIYSE